MLSREQVISIVHGIGIAKMTAELIADGIEKSRRLRPPATGEKLMEQRNFSMGDEERAALARLETAIDARIDAALFLADNQYVTQTKIYATVVSLVIAFAIGMNLGQNPFICFIVGITAVPLAPVAKDLATALQEAVKVFRRK